MREWRLNNPLKSAYSHVKDSARKRRIPFSLTLGEFKEFCDASGYLDLKGWHAGCLHVDRKDHKLGYTKDNIQPLEATENAHKGTWEKKNKLDHPEMNPF